MTIVLLIRVATLGEEVESQIEAGKNTEKPNGNLKHKTHVTSCGRNEPTAAVTT